MCFGKVSGHHEPAQHFQYTLTANILNVTMLLNLFLDICTQLNLNILLIFLAEKQIIFCFS